MAQWDKIKLPSKVEHVFLHQKYNPNTTDIPHAPPTKHVISFIEDRLIHRGHFKIIDKYAVWFLSQIAIIIKEKDDFLKSLDNLIDAVLIYHNLKKNKELDGKRITNFKHWKEMEKFVFEKIKTGSWSIMQRIASEQKKNVLDIVYQKRKLIIINVRKRAIKDFAYNKWGIKTIKQWINNVNNNKYQLYYIIDNETTEYAIIYYNGINYILDQRSDEVDIQTAIDRYPAIIEVFKDDKYIKEKIDAKENLIRIFKLPFEKQEKWFNKNFKNVKDLKIPEDFLIKYIGSNIEKAKKITAGLGSQSFTDSFQKHIINNFGGQAFFWRKGQKIDKWNREAIETWSLQIYSNYILNASPAQIAEIINNVKSQVEHFEIVDYPRNVISVGHRKLIHLVNREWALVKKFIDIDINNLQYIMFNEDSTVETALKYNPNIIRYIEYHNLVLDLTYEQWDKFLKIAHDKAKKNKDMPLIEWTEKEIVKTFEAK